MTTKFFPSLLLSVLFISNSTAFDGDIHDFYLPNGLKVILMEKHAAPKVAVSVFYNVGSKNEIDGQRGITRLIVNLMSKGTKKYSAEKATRIRTEYNAHYGDNSNRDRTYFYTELPVEYIEFALDFEADRMGSFIIDEEMLAKSKAEHKANMDELYNNQVNSTFSNLTGEFMPIGHPYKIHPWGSWEQVDTLSVKTCQDYFDTFFAPNNAVFVVVGDILPKKITKFIYDYFSSLLPADHIPPEPDLSFKNVNDKTLEFHIKNPTFPLYSNYTGIMFMIPTARDDDAIILEHFAKILLMDGIRGGDLFKQYSKNRRLMVLSFVNIDVRLGPSSFLVVGLNVLRNGSIKKIKSRILSTFKSIGKIGIDQELLDQYRKVELLREYKNGYEFWRTARKLGNAELIYGDYKIYNRKMDILEKLSNEDFKKVTTLYLHEGNINTFLIKENKKTWNTLFLSFWANQIIFRFWDPFH